MKNQINALVAMVIVAVMALVSVSYGINGDLVRYAILSVTALGGVELYQRLKENGSSEKDLKKLLTKVSDKLEAT